MSSQRVLLFAILATLAGCGGTTLRPVPLGDENCTNKKDDNGDGKADCFDPKCFAAAACKFDGEMCANGLDDNRDGKTDCAEAACLGQACGVGCLCVPGRASEVDCGDGDDNDDDGFTDCSDTDCKPFSRCGGLDGGGGGAGGGAGGGSGGGSAGGVGGGAAGGAGGGAAGGAGGGSAGGAGGGSAGGTGGGAGGGAGGGSAGGAGGGSAGGAGGGTAGGAGGGTAGGAGGGSAGGAGGGSAGGAGGGSAGGAGGGTAGGAGGGAGGGSAGTGVGLEGLYFNGSASAYATGSVTRLDPTINFNWALAAPVAGINTNNFSVMWSGRVEAVYSETYTFYAYVDDGVRVWVDGKLIINSWIDGSAREVSGTVALTAGQKAEIRIEYYDSTNEAVIQLSWSSASQVKQIVPTSRLYLPVPTTGGLWGDYFDNFFTPPSYVGRRVDGPIDYDWGSGPGIPNFPYTTEYLVRWTGYIIAPSTGTYSFHAVSDDGVRLWVGSVNVINNWTNHGSTEDTGAVTLNQGGRYLLRLDYYQNTGGAEIRLRWTPPGGGKVAIPAASLYR